MQSDDLVLAREVFEDVLEKEPDNDQIRKMLAQILMKTEAYDETIQLYQNVLDNQPDDGESQFAIALVYLQQKKYDDAQVYLKKLINNPAWGAYVVDDQAYSSPHSVEIIGVADIIHEFTGFVG